MAQEIINTGTVANDGTGDPLRTAFIKTDENFDQIWAAGPVGSNIRISGNNISTVTVNTDLALSPNGTANVRINNNTVPGANNIWYLGSATNQWRGIYVGTIEAGNTTISGNITANYFIGDGSQLTGISGNGSDYGNSNVAAYLLTYTGNITADSIDMSGNLIVARTIRLGTLPSGNLEILDDTAFNGPAIKTPGGSGLDILIEPSGNLLLSADGGEVIVEDQTPSTDPNTGALLVLGGVGVGGNINAAENVTAGNLIATGNIQGNVNGFAIGYRDVPVLSLIANTTISIADAGKQYYSTSGSELNLTIANNASQVFQLGATIDIINQGVGNVNILRDGGVTLYLAGNAISSDRTLTSFGVASMTKVATDTWFISGVGLV